MKNANLGMVRVYPGAGGEEEGIDFVKNPLKATFIRNIHLLPCSPKIVCSVKTEAAFGANVCETNIRV